MDAGTYDVSVSHAGYGWLPPRYGVVVNGDLQGVDFYLPPDPNLIQNGNFEADGGWQFDGIVSPDRVEGVGYTGDYALEMGVLLTGLANSTTSEPLIWSASQEVSVPASSQATLAWVYLVSGVEGSGDSLAVTIEGPSSAMTHVLSLDAETWTHEWVDVSDFAGQQVVVRFVLSRESPDDPLHIWLDDVSEGAVPYRVYLPGVTT